MKTIVSLFLFSFVSLALSQGTFKKGFPEMINVPSDFNPLTSELTDFWAVKIRDSHKREFPGALHELAAQHGMTVHKEDIFPGTHIFQQHPGRARSMLPSLNSSYHIEWAEQQIARTRPRRKYSFSDPKFNQQWHINLEGKDMNLNPVWEAGIFGEGCQLAVVDDGLSWHNPDISDNYDPAGSYDFNYGDSDPDADRPADTHGTSAAGCAAAVSNDVCGVGAAPKAKISGIRLISKAATDADEAEALKYRNDRNDVYTNSWGPQDDGKTLEGPGPLLNQAFSDSIQEGRGGKGTIYVWAGGNGKSYGDNGNYDGYNNRPFTLSVSSYDYNGKCAYYSEPCACLFAASPSSGTNGPKIVTTSVSQSTGYCTTTFGGTSASSPMVAGVMCLLLEANPDLTWRDVQHIVVRSSSPIDLHGDWQVNGANLQFSHDYGFGKIDGARIVELARNWVNVPPSVHFDSGIVNPGTMVDKGTTATIYVDVPNDFIVEHIMVYFQLDITRRGDLTLDVVSPFGTTSHMMVKHSDMNSKCAWITSSNANWGESSRGAWQLKFTNGGTRTMEIEEYEIIIDGYLE